MGMGPSHRDPKKFAGPDIGCAFASPDIGGSGPVKRRLHAMGPAGAEIHHRGTPGGKLQTGRLGGNEGLMSDHSQQGRFKDLSFGNGPRYPDQRLIGKHDRSFGHGPDVSGEPDSSGELFKGLG